MAFPPKVHPNESKTRVNTNSKMSTQRSFRAMPANCQNPWLPLNPLTLKPPTTPEPFLRVKVDVA
eukprot:1375690-Amorphochlora_amoeboformis.AAC.2